MGIGDGVGLGATVGSGVDVAVGDGVAVAVAVGLAVAVAVGVRVAVGTSALVASAVAVGDGSGVAVGAGCGVGLAVGVGALVVHATTTATVATRAALMQARAVLDAPLLVLVRSATAVVATPSASAGRYGALEACSDVAVVAVGLLVGLAAAA